MTQPLTITGFSTALFSSWFFVEQYGILFDCGDGVTSSLLQKARKIKHVFVSHADRDHLTGLFQFHQLNGRKGLTIHYPRDCGSFPAIADFVARFDPHTTGTNWNPLAPGDCISLRNDLHVRAIENRHVVNSGEMAKSFSFAVEAKRRKLKPEFAGMEGSKIAALRTQRGDDGMFDQANNIELIYSGDTPVETDGRYAGARMLIHESTFLTRPELEMGTPQRNRHSTLDAVMEMVADCQLDHLILGHFSSRYSDAQIDDAIEHEKQRCGVKIPVDVIYPGRVAKLKIQST